MTAKVSAHEMLLTFFVQEERWYSEELKKELEKVQGQRQQVIPLKILEAGLQQAVYCHP